MGKLKWLGLPLLALGVWAACTSGGGSVAPSPGAEGEASCEPLSELERYRYDAHVTLAVSPHDAPDALSPFTIPMEIDGAIQGQNRQAAIHYPETPQDDLHVVVVGDRYWHLLGTWVPGTLGPDSPVVIPFMPLDLCTSLAPDVVASGPGVATEEINGVAARKYHFDALRSDFSSRLWGPQSDMAQFIPEYTLDIWLAEEGNWPVRFDLSGTGTYPNGQELQAQVFLEIRDIDDKSIEIVPPVDE